MQTVSDSPSRSSCAGNRRLGLRRAKVKDGTTEQISKDARQANKPCRMPQRRRSNEDRARVTHSDLRVWAKPREGMRHWREGRAHTNKNAPQTGIARFCQSRQCVPVPVPSVVRRVSEEIACFALVWCGLSAANCSWVSPSVSATLSWLCTQVREGAFNKSIMTVSFAGARRAGSTIYNGLHDRKARR